MKNSHSNTHLFSLTILLIFSYLLPMQAQDKKEDPPPYEPREINDAFVRAAVTYDEMVERAAHHPYMTHEIVVALELPTPRANALTMLKNFNWTGLFGQQAVQFIAALSTVERDAGSSVALAHLSLPPDLEVFAAMKILEAKREVLWSAPNFYYEGDPREIVPNDPSYASQYHHPLMQNDLAWDITLGSASIIIGITDDGVELAHSDLAANVWTNPGETPGNGVDDDSNGYIDDVNAWDFSSNDNNPNPVGSDTHGTHVAGISAGRTNNSIGIAGTAGGCTIMPLRFYGSGAWTAAVVNATFTYAADNGAQIVNTSYNINGFVGDPVFTAGLQYYYDEGGLHLNSAGNGNELNPVRQAFTQTLLVASTDASDVRSGFSNYGTGIDVAAPGSSILSTVVSNSYDNLSGTSMATPNAAGVAALIWSANPSWTRDQVAAQLLASADNIDVQNPNFIGLLGSGRVNSHAALTTTLPAPQVKSLTGVPDEGVTAAAASVIDFTVTFDQIMDPASVNSLANFELRFAGPNGTFNDPDDVLIPLTTSSTYLIGTNQVNFEIGSLPLSCGDYRLSFISGGLENPFGTDLDGNGNGTAGDNFERHFSIVENELYADLDGDGFGAGTIILDCFPGPGFVLNNDDCDDTNDAIYPGATEVCNGVDDNCDGIVDFPPVATYASTDVPITIPSSGTPTVTSTLVISGAMGNITDLNVKDLLIHHSWMGDVEATLTSPDNTVFTLFDRPGVPASTFGCNQNHVLLTFDDGASFTAADFESTCNTSAGATPPPYAINDTYQPMTALSALNGTSPNGTWTLTVTDNFNGDGGSIEGWSLEISTPGTMTTYYADTDGDDFGDATNAMSFNCTPVPSAGYVLDNTDCDDTNPGIHPGAAEICNGLDDDCDSVPEGLTNSWTGAGGDNFWNNAANWSDGTVPLPCQDVVVPAGTVTVPAGFNAVGKTLDVVTGALLEVEPTATMDIKAD